MVSLHPCILLLREHILLNKMQSLLQQQLFSNDCQTTANFDLFINTELFDSYSKKIDLYYSACNWYLIFLPKFWLFLLFFPNNSYFFISSKIAAVFHFSPDKNYFLFHPIQYRQLLIWFHHEHDCCLILPRLRMIFVAL